MKRATVFLAAVVGVILILAIRFFFAVDECECVVVTQFGDPIKTIREAGLHRKLPWQTVNRFDGRMQLYETPLIEYLTADKKNVILQAFTCWRIEDPLEFFRAVRTFDSATQKLDDIICASVGAKLGDYKMSDLISTNPDEVRIPDIEKLIAAEANRKTQSGYGITIARVGISRLALPEDNARSVYRRMEAERSAIAKEYRALGREEAQKIKSQAEREKSDIIADAYREAQIIKGEGDARAAEIYAEAYSEAPDFFKLLRTLEAYKKMLKQQTVIVMSTDSELLKYLNGVPLSNAEQDGTNK